MSTPTRREFLKKALKCTAIGLGTAPLATSLLSGCKALEALPGTGLNANPATAAGLLDKAKAIKKAYDSTIITPEQEYFIGRAVAAMIIGKYPVYQDEKATQYIRVMGHTLASVSDMPETFGGYHFAIQDTEEINALSAPGGFVFVTRGLLRCCEHEDALAGVLAHEIGHIQNKDGLNAIKQSRYTSTGMAMAMESGGTLAGPQIAMVTDTFGAIATDIVKTFISKGFSRTQERSADKEAITIMKRIGYDPNGLVDMLKLMDKKLVSGTFDFMKTHPAPKQRIQDIQDIIGAYSAVKQHSTRQKRFETALAKV